MVVFSGEGGAMRIQVLKVFLKADIVSKHCAVVVSKK